MDRIEGPVTRAKVAPLAVDWADDPSSVVEVLHHGFSDDRRSGGYAFHCDRGLLVHGVDGACLWSGDLGEFSSRLAKADSYWRRSQHQNRKLGLVDVSPWDRAAAIAVMVSGAKSVAEDPVEERPDVIDTARADVLLIKLRRFARDNAETAALRAVARNDQLLNQPAEGSTARPCPVCGLRRSDGLGATSASATTATRRPSAVTAATSPVTTLT